MLVTREDSTRMGKTEPSFPSASGIRVSLECVPRKKGDIFYLARVRPSSFTVTQGVPGAGELAYTPKTFFLF